MTKRLDLETLWQSILHGIPIIALIGITVHSQAAVKRPNVLFIICDDLNNHIGPSNYSPIQTPSLEKLATESMSFRRAYCQYPVCGPSRASLLSGLYPESTQILDNKSDIRDTLPERLSLPQEFKENGYWTASVGKVFHSPKTQAGKPAWHQQLRFENDELPRITKARKEFESRYGPITQRSNRKRWKSELSKLSTQTRGQTPPGYGPTDLKDHQHKDGKNARQVMKWIAEKPFNDKPFFIVCGIQKPHVPFLAPQKYFNLYPKEQLPSETTPMDDWRDIPSLALVKRYTAFGFQAESSDDALRRDYMQAYHACISFVDAQIGLVLEQLRNSDYWDETIVVVTSDHGYHLGEHFLWGKVSLFEECARTPLIVRVPGITPPASISESLVEHVDLYPTLLELCGLQARQLLQGTSFTPILSNPDHDGKESAYTVVSRGKKLGRSIRTKRWRYAEWDSPEIAELYDLENDPKEYHNLINSAETRSVKARLHQLMLKKTNQASTLSQTF